MLIRNAIISLIICLSQQVYACGCGGPINELSVDIDSSDAIFIGVITEINEEHNFYLADQIGNGLKYINFDVYRSNKGLNKAQLKVSVFDYMSNTSCEGLTYGKQIGDTILVFATEFNNSMLGSYLCGRHPKSTKLTLEEQTFRDTATWIDPRTNHIDAEAYLTKQFPKTNEKNIPIMTTNRKVNLFLLGSLAINILLIIYILVNKLRKPKTN